jgi:hypothetical protein
LIIIFIVILAMIYNCDDDCVCPSQPSDGTDCEILPASLDFGTVGLGTYLDKSFAIVNNLGDTLTGTISESCDDYRIISGEGPYALAPRDLLPVTVRFEPSSEGLKECTIETGSGICNDVSCTATAQIPVDCGVVPSSLDFGHISIGDHLDKSFIIKNMGGGALVGSVSESYGHYSIITGEGAYSLGAGDSLTVTVRFEPTSKGTRTCTIETGSALCSDVECTGEALDPDPGIPDTVWVESLDLPPGTTEFDLRVYLYNDEELVSFRLPLAWDSPDISCDMVNFSGSRADYINTKIIEIDDANQQVDVGAVVFYEQYLQPGSGLLFTLHFSVAPSAAQQVITINKTFIPAAGIFMLSSPVGGGFVPQYIPGEVNLGSAGRELSRVGRPDNIY